MSQAAWYAKLESWVPSWVFEKDPNASAFFQGMASVLNRVEEEYKAHLAETFIDTASDEFLEQMHGDERGKSRLPAEFIESFRNRIKTITSISDCPSLKNAIDFNLINGESTIIENFNGAGQFIDVDCFCDNGVLINEHRYNAFTVILPNQTPPAELFADNEHFCDNEYVAGSLESSPELFELLINIVLDNKAFGVFSRIYERAA